MKEPPGDTHSDGSFIVYERETGQKWAKKRVKMPENPQKCKRISTTILSKSSCWFGLSDKTWTCGLYHPNWPEYLFLAVFAFFRPFCYAKTAFSYSRDILSPCTPVLFMVKDVVKSEYRMIDMWSSVWGGRSAQKLLRRQRRKTYRVQKKHTNLHMWSASQKEMINMWSEQSDSQEQRTTSSFFCRCCIVTYKCKIVKPFSQ